MRKHAITTPASGPKGDATEPAVEAALSPVRGTVRFCGFGIIGADELAAVVFGIAGIVGSIAGIALARWLV